MRFLDGSEGCVGGKGLVDHPIEPISIMTNRVEPKFRSAEIFFATKRVRFCFEEQEFLLAARLRARERAVMKDSFIECGCDVHRSDLEQWPCQLVWPLKLF
ncbi:hypothetical protein EBR21_02710 [bacterium]|nr:hypothetical protein [bacterium]